MIAHSGDFGDLGVSASDLRLASEQGVYNVITWNLNSDWKASTILAEIQGS